jgi:hypothetical protein
MAHGTAVYVFMALFTNITLGGEFAGLCNCYSSRVSPLSRLGVLRSFSYNGNADTDPTD